MAKNELTSGGGAVADSFAPLRAAGARACGILVGAAAETWGVKPEECRAEQGSVIHTPSSKTQLRRTGRGSKKNKTSASSRPKNPKDFKLMGASAPRVDEPDIVTGKAVYGLDVRVPNMLFATVVRSPVPGGKVSGFDGSREKRCPA